MSSIGIDPRLSAPQGPPAGTWPALALVGLALASTLFAAGWLLACGPAFFALPALGYLVIAATVLAQAESHHRHERFGAPNVVTLLRGAVGLLLVAVLAERLAANVALLRAGDWPVVTAAGIAFALDWIDGPIARRRNLTSPFGARFDMEMDALCVLVVSAILVASAKVPLWALGIGATRYVFVAVGWAFPRLATPLPPSFRRKAVCVLQYVVLLAALAPPVGPRTASALACFGLAALVWSFAVDIGWILRQGRSAT
ncbi:CDP-alcohol phosphatidyltransferase family protein [Propylenella binzhouense]|uniref:CDP-alcohol phosphatidyltransferase family protein n=1 Tax=Propylenella binzhouense TaxID=2555902 RepID=A0A964WVR3_9HYPH|nr:CDP-alcohol phosphatidyltransferase family protein [Propylenella binzhouense]MYZ50314.1 CDP-alcohol phosphatidyltransferase family protein [Propylenella binzhouense]